MKTFGDVTWLMDIFSKGQKEYNNGSKKWMYYTGCFTTCGHDCRRWFPRSLWLKKFI